MKIILLDGHFDEMSFLNIPPFILPYIWYTRIAIKDSMHDFIYLTINEYRKNSLKTKALKNAGILILKGNITMIKHTNFLMS